MVIAEEDITERQRATAARQHMNHLLAALGDWHRQAAAGDAEAASSAMCRLLVEAGGYRGAWVGLVERAAPDAPGQVRPLAQAGYEAGYLDSLPPRWRDVGQEDSPLRAVLQEGQPHTHSNGSIIVAMQAPERPVGVLVVDTAEAAPVAAAEAETLRILASNLAVALGIARTVDGRSG